MFYNVVFTFHFGTCYFAKLASENGSCILLILDMGSLEPIYTKLTTQYINANISSNKNARCNTNTGDLPLILNVRHMQVLVYNPFALGVAATEA